MFSKNPRAKLCIFGASGSLRSVVVTNILLV
jgi:hypothetical protein